MQKKKIKPKNFKKLKTIVAEGLLSILSLRMSSARKNQSLKNSSDNGEWRAICISLIAISKFIRQWGKPSQN